jgi:hypothetical protein
MTARGGDHTRRGDIEGYDGSCMKGIRWRQ